MKTTTILSAISLALIFTGISTVFAKQNSKDGSGPNQTMRVKYQVTVNLAVAKTLCNTYQVEILDANGRQVVPAQIYVEGTDVYTFEEQTRQSAGIRIARLAMVTYGDRYVCEVELYTTPAVRLLTFTDGQVYPFALY